MDSSLVVGSSMAVIAISGSVAYVALQFHKRLLAEFLKRIESDSTTTTGMHKHQPKKKVRFADDVIEPSSNNKEYRRKRSSLS